MIQFLREFVSDVRGAWDGFTIFGRVLFLLFSPLLILVFFVWMFMAGFFIAMDSLDDITIKK